MGTSTLQNPVHTFATTGVYAVSLTVNLANGQTATITKKVVIDTSIDYTFDSLEYSFTFDPGDACVTSYLWHFGDGETSTDQNPTHTYAEAGTYTVSLDIVYCDESTETITLPPFNATSDFSGSCHIWTSPTPSLQFVDDSIAWTEFDLGNSVPLNILKITVRYEFSPNEGNSSFSHLVEAYDGGDLVTFVDVAPETSGTVVIFDDPDGHIYDTMAIQLGLNDDPEGGAYPVITSIEILYDEPEGGVTFDGGANCGGSGAYDWCYEWDFTTSNGDWDNCYGRGTYVTDTGWVSDVGVDFVASTPNSGNNSDLHANIKHWEADILVSGADANGYISLAQINSVCTFTPLDPGYMSLNGVPTFPDYGVIDGLHTYTYDTDSTDFAGIFVNAVINDEAATATIQKVRLSGMGDLPPFTGGTEITCDGWCYTWTFEQLSIGTEWGHTEDETYGQVFELTPSPNWTITFAHLDYDWNDVDGSDGSGAVIRVNGTNIAEQIPLDGGTGAVEYNGVPVTVDTILIGGNTVSSGGGGIFGNLRFELRGTGDLPGFVDGSSC